MNMNVFAAVASDGYPAGTAANDSTSHLPNRYDGYKYNSRNSKYFTGIRVSFVTSSGTDIGTFDYVNDNQLTGNFESSKFTRFNPYYISQRCSKVAYATDNCSLITWTRYSATQAQQQLKTITVLKNIFNDYNFASGDITASLLKEKMDASSFVTEYWFIEDHYSGKDYDSDLKGLLSYFVGDDYLTDENIEKLFVVVEPTSIITLKGYHYYGTAYELANIAASTDAYYSNNNNYSDKSTALEANISNFLMNTIPCSGVLSGDISSSITSSGKNIIGFSENLYFENIYIDYSSYSSTCSSGNNLGKDIVTGNYGIGMAVVWMYDFWKDIEEDSLTCELINGSNTNYNINKPYCDNIDDLITNFIANDSKYFGKDEEVKNFYINNCCDEQPTPPSTPSSQICTPKVSVNDCDSYGETVKYNDNNYYYGDEQEFISNCVVNQSSKLDNNLTQTYCEVHCYETLDLSLARFTIPVTAGRFVAFNSNYTNTVSGSRTCYTEPDVNTYKDDLTDANQKLLVEYAKLYAQKMKQKAIDTAKANGKESEWCSAKYNAGGIEYCMSTSIKKKYTGTYIYDKEQYGELYKLVSETCTTTANEETGETKEKCTYTYDEYTWDKYCTLYDYNKEHYIGYEGNSGSVNVRGVSEKWSFGKWCSDGSKYTTVPTANTSETAYNNAKSEVEKLIASMNSCFDWADNDLYSLNPTLSLSYNDGYRYSHVADLVIADYYDDTYTPLKTSSGFSSWIYKCSGSSCEKISREQVYSQYKKLRTIDISYELPNNTYNYIVKNNSVSSLTKPEGNYITLGGNLPVAFGASGTGELNVNYSRLGHITSETGYRTKIENILSNESNYGKWECDFDVTSGLVKDAGLNLIYRPIDLSNPFPDINGQTRNTGSNWCSKDCSTNNSLVKEVITDKQDIYQRDPMYSFVLTPTVIKQIRTYNKENKYDDFKLECNENGNNCISSFLTSIIEGNLNNYGFNASPSGTCINGANNARNLEECHS